MSEQIPGLGYNAEPDQRSDFDAKDGEEIMKKKLLCSICSSVFKNPTKLRRHIRRVHHIYDSDPVTPAAETANTNISEDMSNSKISCSEETLYWEHQQHYEEEQEYREEDDEEKPNIKQIVTDFYCDAIKAKEEGRLPSKKILKRMCESGKLQEQIGQKKEWDSQGISTIVMNAIADLPPNEPIVGLSHIAEVGGPINSSFSCDLCSVEFNLSSIISHLTGLKHRKKYLKMFNQDHHQKLKMLEKKSNQIEFARKLCLEIESRKGRGTPKFVNNPQPLCFGVDIGPNQAGPFIKENADARQNSMDWTQSCMSSTDQFRAVEDLKHSIILDLQSRCVPPVVAEKILESRLQLLFEYMKKGVPFHVARDRVIHEEERFGLLIDFERQMLSFEEAEARIDHRFQLIKWYEKQGMTPESAKEKVVNEQVIFDFRTEFQTKGLSYSDAQKWAENRLRRIKDLQNEGIVSSNAIEKIMTEEAEFMKEITLQSSSLQENSAGQSWCSSQADGTISLEKADIASKMMSLLQKLVTLSGVSSQENDRNEKDLEWNLVNENHLDKTFCTAKHPEEMLKNETRKEMSPMHLNAKQNLNEKSGEIMLGRGKNLEEKHKNKITEEKNMSRMHSKQIEKWNVNEKCDENMHGRRKDLEKKNASKMPLDAKHTEKQNMNEKWGENMLGRGKDVNIDKQQSLEKKVEETPLGGKLEEALEIDQSASFLTDSKTRAQTDKGTKKLDLMEQEFRLEEFDQKCRDEFRQLFAEMLEKNLTPVETKNRILAIQEEHAKQRNKLIHDQILVEFSISNREKEAVDGLPECLQKLVNDSKRWSFDKEHSPFIESSSKVMEPGFSAHIGSERNKSSGSRQRIQQIRQTSHKRPRHEFRDCSRSRNGSRNRSRSSNGSRSRCRSQSRSRNGSSSSSRSLSRSRSNSYSTRKLRSSSRSEESWSSDNSHFIGEESWRNVGRNKRKGIRENRHRSNSILRYRSRSRYRSGSRSRYRSGSRSRYRSGSRSRSRSRSDSFSKGGQLLDYYTGSKSKTKSSGRITSGSRSGISSTNPLHSEFEYKSVSRSRSRSYSRSPSKFRRSSEYSRHSSRSDPRFLQSPTMARSESKHSQSRDRFKTIRSRSRYKTDPRRRSPVRFDIHRRKRSRSSSRDESPLCKRSKSIRSSSTTSISSNNSVSSDNSRRITSPLQFPTIGYMNWKKGAERYLPGPQATERIYYPVA